MTLLDRFGKLAMDTVGKAARLAGKYSGKSDDLSDVPIPEQNASPFAVPEEEPEDDAPLANVDFPAQVFGPGTDPWTGRTLQTLADHQVEHQFVDLEAEGGMRIETMLVRETQQHRPPYVFLRGDFIGGYDALNEIVRLGQIEELTTHPDERDKGKGRTRIVIAKRNNDDVRPGEIGNPDDR
jgi:glutaredoxin